MLCPSARFTRWVCGLKSANKQEKRAPARNYNKFRNIYAGGHNDDGKTNLLYHDADLLPQR